MPREVGVGNSRIFVRPRLADGTVRFLAPTVVAPPRDALGAGNTADRLLFRAFVRARSRFQQLPPPTGSPPYRLSLESVLSSGDMQSIHDSGKLVFHTVGDTGGINRDQFQRAVIRRMEDDCDRPHLADRPAFFYHLGDVVYFKGESNHYFEQFYDAYEHYPAPIFAIPGNHDGEYNADLPSLDAFVRNFCATAPGHSIDAQNVVRDTMTQPNVYFTLQTPLATIIGLYSNVPEGGVIQDDQLQWFKNELSAAPTDRALFVALHHPLFSADDHHSGSPDMLAKMQDAIQASGRVPDAVLTGHVHNYQRFTWDIDGRQIPVIVAGGGGYPNLHKVERINGHRIVPPFRSDDSDATLEAYTDNRHGFLRLEVTAQRIAGEFYALPWNEEDRVDRTDRFVVDLATHRLLE